MFSCEQVLHAAILEIREEFADVAVYDDFIFMILTFTKSDIHMNSRNETVFV